MRGNECLFISRVAEVIFPPQRDSSADVSSVISKDTLCRRDTALYGGQITLSILLIKTNIRLHR